MSDDLEKRERDDKDFAIEFAEYLAKAVERFLDFMNRTGIAAGKPAPQAAMTDHWHILQREIYEFRKRAERARSIATERDAEVERLTKERDDLQELLDKNLSNMGKMLADLGRDRDSLRADLDRARELVRSAYNEGFTEGMNEFQKPRSGGKPWTDSNSIKKLAALHEPTGEKA